METLTLLNGNKQIYTRSLPKLVILGEKWNDMVLQWVKDNTGLEFIKFADGMEAYPESSDQVIKLLMKYNFKTQYQDNLTHGNTLFLKGDYHVGFKVDSICYDCCKRNHININGLKPGDYLAC